MVVLALILLVCAARGKQNKSRTQQEQMESHLIGDQPPPNTLAHSARKPAQLHTSAVHCS